MGAKQAAHSAIRFKVQVTKAEKKAKAKVKQEKVDKVNAKNSWVKNMVKYAEKEKSLKRVGEGRSKKKAKLAMEHQKKQAVKAKQALRIQRVKAKAGKEKNKKA